VTHWFISFSGVYSRPCEVLSPLLEERLVLELEEKEVVVVVKSVRLELSKILEMELEELWEWQDGFQRGGEFCELERKQIVEEWKVEKKWRSRKRRRICLMKHWDWQNKDLYSEWGDVEGYWNDRTVRAQQLLSLVCVALSYSKQAHLRIDWNDNFEKKMVPSDHDRELHVNVN
jgi:hypothetical protein